MSPPVDFHLAVVQPVAPFAQRSRRQMQNGGVFAHAHPAPVHRLDMHRPERLEGAIALIRAHAKAQTGASPATLFSPFKLLLAAQFCLIFRLFAGRFLAGQMVQPAIERALPKSVLAAIVRPIQAALAPRLDVNQPPGLPRLVLKMSQIHRRSSMPRRNPTCRDLALLNLGAETGRLHTTGGWQDKADFQSARPAPASCCLHIVFRSGKRRRSGV